MVDFASPAEAVGIDFDWQIKSISVPRPMKEWVFIPVLFILSLLAWNHRRRALTI